MPGTHWTRFQKKLLKQQHQAGVPLRSIVVAGKSLPAINGQLTRLRKRRIIKRFRREPRKRWLTEELEHLKLCRGQKLKVSQIAATPFFHKRKRSRWSISGVIRRSADLADPKHSAAGKNATHLFGYQLQMFHRYIRRYYRQVPLWHIAKRFHVARCTVQRHLKRLGLTPLTWKEAIRLPLSQAKWRKSTRLGNIKGWQTRHLLLAKQRAQLSLLLEKRLDKLRELMEQRGFRNDRRICRVCHKQWFAVEPFFRKRQKREAKRNRVTLSLICEPCRIGHRQVLLSREAA